MSFVDDTIPDNASSALITSDYESLIPVGLEITPTELYFGALVVGEETLDREVSIKNIGKKTLRIVSVELSAQEQFSMAGEPPDLLKPGESFSMSVRYFSTMRGMFGGMIVITTSEDRAPYYIGLSGRVVGSLYLEDITEEFRGLVDEEAWARAEGDAAEAGKRLLLQATMTEEIDAKLLDERIARVTEYEALVSDVTALTSRVNGNTAGITEESTTRASADLALASRILHLETTVITGEDAVARAAITAESATRAEADLAEASARETAVARLELDGTTTNARIDQEIITRSEADEAEATARTSLATSLRNETDTKINASATTLMQAISTATEAEATERTSLATQMRGTYPGSNISFLTSGLLYQEREARVTASAALVTSITEAEARVNNNLASVRTTLESNIETTDGRVTEIGARYTTLLTVNGLVGGFEMYNDGTTVSAGFDVDAFFIGRTQANKRKPFYLENDVVYMDDAFIRKLTFNKLRADDGSLIFEDGKLKAEYIEVGDIVGSNILNNAGFAHGTSGWMLDYQGDAGVTMGVNNPGWYPVGGDALYIHQPNDYFNGQTDKYQGIYSTQVPAQAGKRYEYSILTGAHRCRVYMFIGFQDVSGADLQYASCTSENDEATGGGQSLQGYKLLSGFVTAPPGTVAVRMWVWKTPTKPGHSDSWMFVTRAFIGECGANQTIPSPWSLGGSGTKITGAGINTPSLSAITANLGHVDAGSLNINNRFVVQPDGTVTIRSAATGGRLEVTNDVIKVFDANNVLRVQLGNLSV